MGTVGIEAGAEQARDVVTALLEDHKPVAKAEPGDFPGWDQLPADRQQAYLESLLSALLKVGESGPP